MSVPAKLYITSKNNDFTKYKYFADNIRLRKGDYNKRDYKHYVLENLEAINIGNLQNSIIIDDSDIYNSLNYEQKE